MKRDFDDDSIEQIKNFLIFRKETLAVAESVTAGFLQAALASADNATGFFQGGITAYNIDQKVKHLGISRIIGEECNCVSAEISVEMARGVVQLFGCDWGIAVTGYSTPVEESGFKLFAYFSICYNKEITDTGRIELDQEKPKEAQIKYVNMILGRIAILSRKPEMGKIK